MNSLVTKYSNWQIYGFFGLFLATAIWIHYASFLVQTIVDTNDVVSSILEMVPFLILYVGIPLGVSFLIAYVMRRHNMLDRQNLLFLLMSGLMTNMIFWAILSFV